MNTHSRTGSILASIPTSRLHNPSGGFSLVELSIVLVILGLLIGGILAGQSLIRASEMRTVATEFQRYQTAANAFRDRYFFLPGDMPNATSFWGAHPNCGIDVVDFSSSATCNGDGNKLIDGGGAGEESGSFWQQLANAGLIESMSGGYRSGKLNNSAWTVGSVAGTYAGNTGSFAGVYGNYFYFQTTNVAPIITAAEAWNLDTKLDDGKPSAGGILGYKGSTTFPCTDRANTMVGAGDATAVYSLSTPGNICHLTFVRLF